MRKGRGAIVALGILLLGLLCSVITYVGLSLLGLVQLDNKEVLTFNVEDVEKEYDGTPLKASQYYIEEQLPDGYSVYVEYLGELTQVGTTLSSLQVQVFDEQDVNVTSKFEIRVNKGNIKVVSRSIKIEVEKERYYIEGNKIKVNLIESGDGVTKLLPGHRIIAEIPEDFDIEQDNIQRLKITPKIVDSIGTDVTGLYSIGFKEPSKLQKGASDITVSHMVYEKEYDGKPFTPKLQITSGVLEKNHSLSYKVISDVTNVGIYTNYKIDFVVYNDLGQDVTGSYNISGQTTITVTINPRQIRVTPEETEKAYDGDPFEKSQLSVLEGSLLEGHTAYAVFDSSITDVGTKQTGYSVEIYNSEKVDVTKQYAISKKSETVNLVVKKSKIELAIFKTSKEFDGKNFGTLKENEDYTITSGGLIKGHKLTVSYSKDFSEVGRKETEVIVKVLNENNTDVSSIYDLIYDAVVTIEIKGIVIQVELDDISKTYDGKNLEELVEEKLSTINLLISTEYKDQGLTGITFKDKILKMTDACEAFPITSDMIVGIGEKKDQFAFEVVGNPVIEIKQKEISLQIIDGDLTLMVRYDDQPVSITKNDIEIKEKDGLVDKHSIVAVYSQSYEMDFSGDDILLSVYSVDIYDNENSKDATHNYKINYEGVRNIEIIFDSVKLDVKVNNIEIDWNLLFDYDDEPSSTEIENAIYTYLQTEYKDKNKDLFEIVNGNAIPSTIKVSYSDEYEVTEIKPYLEYEIEMDKDYFEFLKYNPHAYDYEDLNDYFEAFEVENVYTGKVTLTNAKKNFSINLPTVEGKYTSTGGYETLIKDAVDSLALPNGFAIASYDVSFNEYEVDQAGTYIYSIENVIIDGIDDTNQHRYEVVINAGSLVLTKEIIEINLPSLTYEYTEEETASEKIINAIGGLEVGAATINVSSISNMEDYKNPGMYSYTIDNDDVDYDADYYEVVINPGYVTVNKKIINIDLPSITYDYTEEETASEIIIEAISGLEIGEATLNPSHISGMDYYKTPGTYSYVITENDVTYENRLYELVINPGYVTVNKKVIEINLPTFTYDYTEEKTASEIIIDAISGLEIDKATLNPSYINGMEEWKTPGTYSYVIQNSDVTYESQFYEIIINPGYVTVNKKIINIDLPSITYDYTEEETASEKIVNTISGLEIGEATLNPSYISGMGVLTPGTYSYVITKNDVTYENRLYDLVINPGYVTVTKQKIEVNLPSISYEYDSSTVASDVVVDAINGMKINDDLDLSITYIGVLYNVKPAGVYTYTINKSDISGYNSSLHDVTINAGTLTVTKKNIYISVPSVVCSLTSYETKVDVISAAVDAVLASCDPNMVVTYNVNPSVEYLLEGTYSLAAYVSFNLSDSNNYNIIISSIGTITVIA